MDQAPQQAALPAADGRRRFDRINDWLTLAANLGVIAGLLVLAYEIQQNTSIARASAYRDHVQDIAAWREMAITDPDVARLYGTYVGEGLEALGGQDRGRLVGMINNLMGAYENAWFAWRYGVLDDQQWERFHLSACLHFARANGQGLNLRFVSDAYRGYLAETCAEGAAATHAITEEESP